MSDEIKQHWIRANKIYLMAKNQEDDPGINGLLEGLNVGTVEDDDSEPVAEIEIPDNTGVPKKYDMVEVKIQTIFCMEDVSEVSAIYGQPERCFIELAGGAQRIIDRAFEEMVGIWESVHGKFL